MKALLLIVSIAIILVVLLVIYGCMVIASRCSREEEREYLLIDAIRYGYEVEKEKLYHVVNKENYFMLRKYDGLVDIMQVSSTVSRDEFGKDTRFMLTEQEIKDFDKRYWAFAEEVTD